MLFSKGFRENICKTGANGVSLKKLLFSNFFAVELILAKKKMYGRGFAYSRKFCFLFHKFRMPNAVRAKKKETVRTQSL